MKCLPLLGVFVVGALCVAACDDGNRPGAGKAGATGVQPAVSTQATGSGTSAQPAAASPTRRACHDGIGVLLASLSEPVTIELYASRQSDDLSRAADQVAQLLTTLEKGAKGKLTHQVIDAGSAAGKSAAKAHGLQPIGIAAKDEVKQGYFGLVLRHGPEPAVIPVLSPDHLGGLEFWLAGKIRELKHRKLGSSVRLGVVTGKEEVSLTEPNLVAFQGGRPGPTLKAILTRTMPYYSFTGVDLKADVDADLQGLIVTQPGQSFSEDELKRIDAFVMKGRPLVVFASAVNVAPRDSAMAATVDTRGLDKLLTGYGIELQAALVYDPEASAKLPVNTQGGGTGYIRAPAVLEVAHQPDAPAGEQRLDPSFAGFTGMTELAFPFSSPLVVLGDRQPNARLRVVARSSPAALTNRATSQHLGMKRPVVPSGEKGQQALAVVAEGTLQSPFTAGVSAETRVLVLSSAQFLVNPFARAGNPEPMPGDLPTLGGIGGDAALQTVAMPYAQRHLSATILAFTNSLDWMVGAEHLTSCSALVLSQPKKAGGKSGGLFSFGR